jgi:hypothetical protein
MDRLEAARDRPAELVSVLVRAYAEASESELQLVRVVFPRSDVWSDLEKERDQIDRYLGGKRPEEKPAAPARPLDQASLVALGRAANELALTGGETGVRVLGLGRDHAWYRLGLRNGDVVRRIGTATVYADDLAARLASLGDGVHRLELLRRGEALTLELTVGDGRGAPAAALEAASAPGEAGPARGGEVRVFFRARVADARALREELERSGLTLRYDASQVAFIVGGVSPDTLPADLGLEDGDALRTIGGRSAYEAHAEGQGGIGFLVDGLDGREISTTLARGGTLVTLRWTFQ